MAMRRYPNERVKRKVAIVFPPDCVWGDFIGLAPVINRAAMFKLEEKLGKKLSYIELTEVYELKQKLAKAKEYVLLNLETINIFNTASSWPISPAVSEHCLRGCVKNYKSPPMHGIAEPPADIMLGNIKSRSAGTPSFLVEESQIAGKNMFRAFWMDIVVTEEVMEFMLAEKFSNIGFQLMGYVYRLELNDYSSTLSPVPIEIDCNLPMKAYYPR